MANIDGTGGNDILNGTPDNDNIRGFDGDDSLTGGDGFDFLEGDAGNDTLRGDEGDDFVVGGQGDDLLDGGDGRDRADYRNDIAGVTADLRTGIATDGWGTTDTLVSIERLIGSTFDDVLLGDDSELNSFTGEGGNDLIDGRGGFDYVWYGRADGPVTVNLADGTATGGEGTDTLISIEGLGGSNYADLLIGSDADNYFDPDQEGDEFSPNYMVGGADTVDGGGGFDTVGYQNATQGVAVDLGAGTGIDGNGNTDTLISIEGVRGSDFDDHLTGDDGRNRLEGNDGNDTIIGGDGNDDIDAGAGDDLIDLSGQTDTFGGFTRPGLGSDIIIGSEKMWNDFGEGHDLSYSELKDVGGLTLTVGDQGMGTVVSGTPGMVNDSFSYSHFFFGSSDNDLMTSTATDGRFQGWGGG